jgi:hypothetical protein
MDPCRIRLLRTTKTRKYNEILLLLLLLLLLLCFFVSAQYQFCILDEGRHNAKFVIWLSGNCGIE